MVTVMIIPVVVIVVVLVTGWNSYPKSSGKQLVPRLALSGTVLGAAVQVVMLAVGRSQC